MKALRAAAILTQSEFAAEIGVSERTVQDWEAGVSAPRAPSLRRLRDFAALLEETA